MRALVALSATGILIIILGVMFLPVGWFVIAYIVGGAMAVAAPTAGLMAAVERGNR